jgi:hypothetical protein
MARTPRPIQPNRGYAGTGRVLGDPPPVEAYPVKRGGRAVPDRSRAPDIGAACHDTDFVGPAPRVDPNTNAGPEIGPTENAKTRQEHGDAVRESRGVRTRPVRPGQHA